MYLGQSNGTAFLYLASTHEVFRVPTATVVVRTQPAVCRPAGMCVDGMVEMCRWHGDFTMLYSSGRDPLLVQIALGCRRRLGGGLPLRR